MFLISLPKTVGALALAAMLLSIAGCTNRDTVPGTFGQARSVVPLNSLRANSTGASGKFSAAYLSSHSVQSGCALFSFKGAGHASLLGAGSEAGTLRADQVYTRCIMATGNAVLSSTSTPNNTIKLQLSFVSPGSRSWSPSCRVSRHRGTWTADGGTGKFAHATGSGYVSIDITKHCIWRVTWTGFISY